MRKYSWADPPSHIAFPVARTGYPLIFSAAFVTAVFALLELTVPALLGLCVTFFIASFFRDPDRVIPNEKGCVVSPADGKVISIGQVRRNPFDERRCMKISIFMSIFNAHINRIPYDGTIKSMDYNPGEFLPANLDKSSEKNERNAVLLETDSGERIAFVQIAGLIARRIICGIQPGDLVVRGQRYGMICFGSRLDVYLPDDTAPNVAVGDRVKAGISILGYLK